MTRATSTATSLPGCKLSTTPTNVTPAAIALRRHGSQLWRRDTTAAAFALRTATVYSIRIAPEADVQAGLIAQLNAVLETRYAIERELGRGGMATVYLARDLRHDRRVALKLLD